MDCSFCSRQIMQGTGTMYVKKDATAYWFCSKKCEKNMLKLRRSGHKAVWTKRFHDMKDAMVHAGAAKAGAESKSERPKKGGKKKR